jgi:signal transduction histidine kinase/tetratricopeptide (TPR) repeat protein
MKNAKQKSGNWNRLWGRRPWLLLFCTLAIPGLFLSVGSLASLKNQRLARELSLRQVWKEKMAVLGERLVGLVRGELSAAWQALAEKSRATGVEEELPAVLLDLIKGFPLVKYPFIVSDQEAWLFPRVREMPVPASLTEPVSLGAAELEAWYEKGEALELTKRDWPASIRQYQKGLAAASADRDRLALNLAVARCYFKWGKYPQSIAFLQSALGLVDPGVRDARPKVLSILHQMALAHDRAGETARAADRSQEIYERILAQEAGIPIPELEFYKKSALAYLENRIREEGAKPMPREKRKDPSLDAIPRFTLDRALNLDVNVGAKDPRIADRLAQINDFYLQSDDKSRFYDRLRHRLPRLLTLETGASSDPWIEAEMGLVYRWLQDDQTGARLVGFAWHEGAILDLCRSSLAETKVTDGLALSLGRSKEEPAEDGAAVLHKQALTGCLEGYDLRLTAPLAGYFAEEARRGQLMHYGLIVTQVLTLLAGLMLFIRLLRREMTLMDQKSRFIEAAAHTLKSPLARIRLLSEQLSLDWLKGEAKRREYLGRIITHTEGMSEMVNRLLTFSSSEAGALVYQKSMADLPGLVKAVLDDFSALFQREGFVCRVECDENMRPFAFDALALRLMLENLIHNALRYSPHEKTVTVAALDQDGWAVLTVSDRGMGIEKAELGLIFEKFYRSPSARSMEGSGLGLYLVRDVVRAHDGHIEVQSEVGKGTVFTVSLPMTTGEDA